MFAIVNMMRMTGIEISKKSMMIQTMFAIGNMMPITGVEISKKSKCAEQTAISKSLKTL